MEMQKKQFVAPTLTVEASLEDVTLISGGGKHGHGHNNHHDNHNNNHHNDNGHRGH